MPFVKDLEPGDVFAHNGGVFLVVEDDKKDHPYSAMCVVLKPVSGRSAVAAFHTTPFNHELFVETVEVEELT